MLFIAGENVSNDIYKVNCQHKHVVRENEFNKPWETFKEFWIQNLSSLSFINIIEWMKNLT